MLEAPKKRFSLDDELEEQLSTTALLSYFTGGLDNRSLHASLPSTSLRISKAKG